MLNKMLALVALSILTHAAHAALYDRGSGLIYDDVLDITWLQDANYAQTSGYATTHATGEVFSSPLNIQTDGRMGWDAANIWAENLVYGGFDDWRLASFGTNAAASPEITASSSASSPVEPIVMTGELAHMFYVNLGNTPDSGVANTTFMDAATGQLSNILNVQAGYYWDRDIYSSFPALHKNFCLICGVQEAHDQSSNYAWAVRAGDVSQVPVLGAVWLFCSALLGLTAIKRS